MNPQSVPGKRPLSRHLRPAFALGIFLAAACGERAAAVATTAEPITRTSGGNITRGCVERYDSTADYFPEKFVPRAATQVSVSYHRHYKVLTITPREDTTLRLQYALVQCGTPAPAGWDARRVINVPVRRFAVTHPDYYGAVDILGMVDRVVAIASEKYLFTRSFRDRVAAGNIRQVGAQAHLDFETLISLKPDVVLSYWSVSPEFNAPAKVDEVSLKSGAMIGHWEKTPLGSLDWLGVLAAYGNKEGLASHLIDSISARYDSLKTLAQNTGMKKTYINGAPSGDRWQLQRRKQRVFNMHADAGLTYAFEPLIDSAAFPATTLEAALNAGRKADVWLNVTRGWKTIGDIATSDPRLAQFAAAKAGMVWTTDLGRDGVRVPYEENWLLRPDAELADLIALSQPALLPNHQFTFYRQLTKDTP